MSGKTAPACPLTVRAKLVNRLIAPIIFGMGSLLLLWWMGPENASSSPWYIVFLLFTVAPVIFLTVEAWRSRIVLDDTGIAVRLLREDYRLEWSQVLAIWETGGAGMRRVMAIGTDHRVYAIPTGVFGKTRLQQILRAWAPAHCLEPDARHRVPAVAAARQHAETRLAAFPPLYIRYRIRTRILEILAAALGLGLSVALLYSAWADTGTIGEAVFILLFFGLPTFVFFWLAIAAVLRSGSVSADNTITVRYLWGRRQLSWSELERVQFGHSSQSVALLSDKYRLVLPLYSGFRLAESGQLDFIVRAQCARLAIEPERRPFGRLRLSGPLWPPRPQKRIS